jgi:hypothetical protein
MSSLRLLGSAGLALPLVLAASVALGSGVDGGAVPGVERAADKARPAALPAVGMMADAGLPDGMGGSLVYRPNSWLRLHGGGTYNMISSGLRAGAALLPFGWGPSLTVEAGHYFDGDANGLVRRFAGAGYQSNAILERVGYDYANGHVGLDFGMRRVTFFIHGGVSFIRATIHNVDDVVQSHTASADASSTQLSIKQDPIIRAFTPSVKLGLIVYLW